MGGNRGAVARPGRPPARGTESGMGPDDLLCSRNARPYPQKEVKVEAQVEQRSIRSGVFSILNLDLSLDLSMGRAQLRINQAPSLRENKRAWVDHS